MLTPHPHVAESGSAEEGEIARTDRQAIPEGPALRREIERWFIRRGVPQFIEGYGTEQSMDRRATPLLIAWLVAWSSLFWFSQPTVPFPWNSWPCSGRWPSSASPMR